MKTSTAKVLLVSCALGLIATRASPATLRTLYNFSALSGPSNTNSDGANPRAALVLSGGVLFGTAYQGGSSGDGTVFRINTDGSGFTNLLNFTGINGKTPYGGLALLGGALYGTTEGGGASLYGTAFRLGTNGTGDTDLIDFTYNTAGNGVLVALTGSGNTLYGATDGGGSGFSGTIFSVNADGFGYSNLHSFTFSSVTTNSDGKSPDAALALTNNMLFGTTSSGGLTGNGTVFRVNTDGSGFTNLYNFTAPSTSFPATNSDGRSPRGKLVLSGNTLFGTARFGGLGSAGTVFKINTDGSGFSVLHSFGKLSFSTNSDGGAPWSGLVLSGGTLYGVSERGRASQF
jgi:uncharacterized repeat protein (TIGR03803 family)